MIYAFKNLKDYQRIIHDTVPSERFSYDEDLQALKITDDSAGVKGVVDVALGYHLAGDTIDVEVEIMNISGTKAKVFLDHHSTSAYQGITNIHTVSTEKTNEFEILKLSLVCTKDGYYKVVVGVTTAEFSEFYVRNLVIDDKKGIDGSGLPYKKDTRIYSVQVYQGAFILQANTLDSCVISESETNNTWLSIKHDVPFSYNRAGISQATINGNNTPSVNKIGVKTRGESKDGIILQFFNLETGMAMTVSDVLALPPFTFNVVCYGYEEA